MWRQKERGTLGVICSLPFPDGSEGKESAHNLGGPEFDPWVREDPLEKEWLLTPVFLPGESHGQGSLALVHVGPKELDMTEGLTHTPLFIAALFTIARTWKQSKCLSKEQCIFTIARTWKQPQCPLADEWIRKL